MFGHFITFCMKRLKTLKVLISGPAIILCRFLFFWNETNGLPQNISIYNSAINDNFPLRVNRKGILTLLVLFSFLGSSLSNAYFFRLGLLRCSVRILFQWILVSILLFLYSVNLDQMLLILKVWVNGSLFWCNSEWSEFAGRYECSSVDSQ